jgi:galactose oxidase
MSPLARPQRPRPSPALALAPALLAILAAAPTTAVAQPAVQGKWSAPFNTVNVMIHANVLPNGKVLFWSRREPGQGLDPHDCTPRVWDPARGTGPGAFSETANKPGYNLFCASQSFLPDGRLLVAGGHIEDQKGEAHVTIYDHATNKWAALGSLPDMSGGRWYPTAVTLPDGGVLVSFGTDKDKHQNVTQQVWENGGWRNLSTASFNNAPYYPRMHAAADGRVFMSGPLQLTQFLDTSGTGNWTPFADRDNVVTKEYAPSVFYTEGPDDRGKVLFIGGGVPPTNDVELLDFNATPPHWAATDPMRFKRRQHNATLLPDGTILVTGGSQGGGAKYAGEDNGFNDLRIGQPIRSAELYDPKKTSGRWTKMAKAGVDRCYHSTAILLPDATVLSAGGGEYNPPNRPGQMNLPEDTHKDAQIFSPPYLFKGDGSPADRPEVTAAPTEVRYGEMFTVGTPHPTAVDKVSWVRLSAVTHSFNTNQRTNVLKFSADTAALQVTAPAGPKACPPGHYMLFVLNKAGVPSVARIIKIKP